MDQNLTIKEKALHPETRTTGTRDADSTAAETEPQPLEDERIVLALQAAGDKKAVDMVVLDLRNIASFTDYFLITAGNNARQVQAIADEIVDRLKKQGTKAQRVEGYQTAEWVLVDYGDFVVHVFDGKARQFYDLERLWRDAARLAIPSETAPDAGSSLRTEES